MMLNSMSFHLTLQIIPQKVCYIFLCNHLRSTAHYSFTNLLCGEQSHTLFSQRLRPADEVRQTHLSSLMLALFMSDFCFTRSQTKTQICPQPETTCKIKVVCLSEEEFTDQRSSHFKLCVAVNFKSLLKKFCPKL